jgi:tetratricopeptide (TPR) repeat protein/serine/threonine protein kinase
MQITINKCIPSLLDITDITNIEAEENPLFSGGQGKIYEVISINNNKVSGLLVKLFENDFPSNLKSLVKTINDNKDKFQIDKCSALTTLPLFLFEGKQGQKVYKGYVMRKVQGKSFAEIIENERDIYVNLPLERRLSFCYQFVEAMHILYSLTIIHADINAENLLIDINKGLLYVIDLDGGAVAKQDEVPVVIGKIDAEWLAPEILEELKRSSSRSIKVKIQCDLWSLTCGIHYLLFGVGPFFFIPNQPDVAKYLRNYEWPRLRNLQGLKIQNEHIFDYYEKKFKEIPKSLQECLKRSIQEGYLYPEKRLIPYIWLIMIKNCIKSSSTIRMVQKNPSSSFSTVNKVISTLSDKLKIYKMRIKVTPSNFNIVQYVISIITQFKWGIVLAFAIIIGSVIFLVSKNFRSALIWALLLLPITWFILNRYKYKIDRNITFLTWVIASILILSSIVVGWKKSVHVQEQNRYLIDVRKNNLQYKEKQIETHSKHEQKSKTIPKQKMINENTYQDKNTEVSSYLKSGFSYFNNGQYDNAILKFSKVIELDPKNVKAYVYRGKAYYRVGQYELAISDYSKAIELDPKNYIVYNDRCVAYIEIEEYNRAISDCTKALKLHPNKSTYFYRGFAYYKLKQYELASLDFNEACNMGNENGCKWIKVVEEKRLSQYLTKLENEINTSLIKDGIWNIIVVINCNKDTLEITLKGTVENQYDKDKAIEIAKNKAFDIVMALKEIKRIKIFDFIKNKHTE